MSIAKRMKKHAYLNLEKAGGWGLNIWSRWQRGFSFLCQMGGSIGRFMSHNAFFRSKDFWLILQDCTTSSLPIVLLVSFLVGLILAFVGALQLKMFGAQIYVASLVTIGMIRIMGAIMTGVIMAGRTGASYAATLGSMQVNEELDALKTMGVSSLDFLALPRLLALMIALPLLTMISDFMGMFGGMVVSSLWLDVWATEYINYSIRAFDLRNFLLGLFHGFVFAGVIACCGCYFGLYCGRDAQSVGQSTTKAVVYSIVWMTVMTGIITLIAEGIKS